MFERSENAIDNIRDQLTCKIESEDSSVPFIPPTNTTITPPPTLSLFSQRKRRRKKKTMDVDEEDEEFDDDEDDDDDDDEEEEENDDDDEEMLLSRPDLEKSRGDVCFLIKRCKYHNNENCKTCKNKSLDRWILEESCVDDDSVNMLGMTQGYVWRWWESNPKIPGRSWHDARKMNCIW